MAMSVSDPGFLAARIDELEGENNRLREQLRAYAAQQTVVRGALSEAAVEKDATARMAHQVVVEERATRAAVENAGSSIGFAVILQVVNFFLLLVVLVGALFWLPAEIQRRVQPRTTTVVPGSVVIGK